LGFASSFFRMTHRRYRHLEKINRYYMRRKGQRRFELEIGRRLGDDALTVDVDQYFLSGHNPLTHVNSVNTWIVERYRPAFRYIDRERPNSILEVGCGFGVSTWYLTDAADHVVGLDMSPAAIGVAKRLFPESDFVCSEVSAYFDENPEAYFDIIVSCYGPLKLDWCERYRKHFGVLIKVGARPAKTGPKRISRRDYLRGKHKLPGYHLGFNCTVYDGRRKGVSLAYPLSYFTWSYLHEFLHYLRNRDRLYLPI